MIYHQSSLILQTLLSRCVRIFAGHSDAVLDVDFAPSGSTVLTASKDEGLAFHENSISVNFIVSKSTIIAISWWQPRFDRFVCPATDSERFVLSFQCSEPALQQLLVESGAMCRWCAAPTFTPRAMLLGFGILLSFFLFTCAAIWRIRDPQPLCTPQRMPQLLRAKNVSVRGFEELVLQCDVEKTGKSDCVQCKMTEDGLYFIQIEPYRLDAYAAEEYYEAWERYHYAFRLSILNDLATPLSIHPHGLNPVNPLDGTAYIDELPIQPGEHPKLGLLERRRIVWTCLVWMPFFICELVKTIQRKRAETIPKRQRMEP